MQQGGFQSQPLMRLTLGLTLSLLLLFWASNFAMYFSRMGLTPASVTAYYNGSEEDFSPPRSAQSMLETTHMHLPMMALVLLVLTHLLIFLPLGKRAKVVFICATFLSVLMEEGGGWLVRFVSPALAPVKIAGFVLLQSTIAFLLVALGVFLLRAARRDARHRAQEAPDEGLTPARVPFE